MAGFPIDHGWAWVCVLGCHVVTIFFVGGFKSIGILLLEFNEHFQASSASTAVLIGITGAFMSLFAPLATPLGEQYTERRVVMIGGLFIALGSFLGSFATNMIMIICLYGIPTGIGFGCCFGPAMVVIGKYFDRRRSLASGLSLAGGSMGQLLLPLVLRSLIDAYTWRGALLVYSAIVLHVVAAALLFRPLSFYQRSKGKGRRNKHGWWDCVSGRSKRKEKEKDDEEEPEITAEYQHDTENTGSGRVANGGMYMDKNGRGRVGKLLSRSEQEEESNPGSGGAEKLSSAQDGETCCEPVDRAIEETGAEDVEESLIEAKTAAAAASDAAVRAAPHPLSRLEKDGYISTSTGSLLITSVELSSRADLDACGTDLELAGGGDEPVEEVERKVGFLTLLRISFCCCFLRDRKAGGISLFDWSLFKRPIYLMFFVGICAGHVGCANLFLLIPGHVEDLGFSRQQGANLLSVCGVCDLVSRISGGWFADLGYVRRGNIMAFSILCTAAATILCPLLGGRSLAVMYVFVVAVGIMAGFYTALFLVYLIDLVGLKRAPKGFGMTLMGMGFINLPIPWWLGRLRDTNGNWHQSFVICALLMILCSVLIFCEPLFRRLDDYVCKKQAIPETANPS